MVAALPLSALEYSPWLGRVYEFESRLTYANAASRKIDLDHQTRHQHLCANLLTAGLLLTPAEDLSTEFEFTGAKTRDHSFMLDSTKACVRYLWLNDIPGDPVSLTTGASIAYVPTKALHDISLMHHGSFEAVFHAAVGKELDFHENSFFHPSLIVFLGVANRGSPWTALELHLEKAFSERYCLDFFLHGEKGFGSKALRSVHDFQGYAALDYRFLDAGVAFKYTIPPFGSLTLSAAQRLKGVSCPKDTTSVELALLIPFSL